MRTGNRFIIGLVVLVIVFNFQFPLNCLEAKEIKGIALESIGEDMNEKTDFNVPPSGAPVAKSSDQAYIILYPEQEYRSRNLGPRYAKLYLRNGGSQNIDAGNLMSDKTGSVVIAAPPNIMVELCAESTYDEGYSRAKKIRFTGHKDGHPIGVQMSNDKLKKLENRILSVKWYQKVSNEWLPCVGEFHLPSNTAEMITTFSDKSHAFEMNSIAEASRPDKLLAEPKNH